MICSFYRRHERRSTCADNKAVCVAYRAFLDHQAVVLVLRIG